LRAEESASRDTRLLLALLLTATLVRIGFAWSLGLGIDESYMVAAGRTLGLGYFDHPPAAWWMQWAAAHLFGTEAPVAVRSPFIAAFALSTWFMFRLGVAVAGSRAGLWAAVAFSLSPVFGVTTGTWVLPDGPLDCALLGAALCLVHAMAARGGAARAWWAGAGVCAGLALFSKYTAVLTIGGAFLYLLATPAHRRWLARPEPYVAGLLALLVFSPVIVWNATHHWASFAFQGDRAAGLRFRPGQPFVVLAGEALFVLPWIWLPMMMAAFRALVGNTRTNASCPGLPRASMGRRYWGATPLDGRIKSGHDGDGWRQHLLCWLGAPPIVVFALVALWSSGRVLYHWAAPGYLMLFPLLGAWLADRPRLAARGSAATAAFVLIALAIVCTQVRLDWLHPAFAAARARDPDIEAIDWISVRQSLAARDLLAPGTIVGVPNWRDAGKIGYALGPAITVTVLNADARQFGFVAPAASFVGRDMLILAPEHADRAAARLAALFAGIEALAPAPIRHAGRTLAEVAVFRTGPLLSWPAPHPQARANTSPAPAGKGSSAQLSPPSRVPNTSPVFAAK
jgi:4-amino-4-deoxy-L-arabinose transferase-like glycosyltransferase